jgi:hypothetical protein
MRYSIRVDEYESALTEHPTQTPCSLSGDEDIKALKLEILETKREMGESLRSKTLEEPVWKETGLLYGGASMRFDVFSLIQFNRAGMFGMGFPVSLREAVGLFGSA